MITLTSIITAIAIKIIEYNCLPMKDEKIEAIPRAALKKIHKTNEILLILLSIIDKYLLYPSILVFISSIFSITSLSVIGLIRILSTATPIKSNIFTLYNFIFIF